MLFDILKKSKTVVFFGILKEKIEEAKFIVHHFATGDVSGNSRKLSSVLLIETHALEKGMSLPNVRPGFGIAKYKNILHNLERYVKLGGNDTELLQLICSTLFNYLDFVKNDLDYELLKTPLLSFCRNNEISIQNNIGGVEFLSHDDLVRKENDSFLVFSQSRSSVRDFSDRPIDKNSIIKALEICRNTPSACNRQSWRIHVYYDKDKRDKLFSLQDGCKGFYEDMQCAILICGDSNNYSFQEQGLLFVDGGLYAMNLLYALHYYDFATIPLSMGMKVSRIKSFQKKMGIPTNEIPVILIGVGCYKDSYKVAKSNRFHINNYCKEH